MATSCSEATVNKKQEEFYISFFRKQIVVWNPTEVNPQSRKIKLIEVPNIFLLF